MKGRIAWKRGLKSQAMSFYAEAAGLEPDSEAATALEQARQVMDFYNKDLYNP
ncbi:MAG: tetratricopeptide repeat protein [Muribaculaceae bacterium]|nr:tetratricopeptide repeat protein [Muribaculaceae bacterium]